MSDTANLQRARDLLDRVPLVDGHNDLPYVVRNSAARGDVRAWDMARPHPETDTDIPRLKQGKVGTQIWAAFVLSNADHAARTALEQIDLIRTMNALHADTFHPVLTSADIHEAKRQGKIGSIIAVEGGVGMENSLAPLRIWHAAGVRLMTLCHNGTLDWVDSATDEARHGGLTEFGRSVVREMNRLGIIVDCAHVSPDVMRQVLDISTAPIVFSHSNARAVCDHVRNVPDDVLATLRAKNGLVMATFIPGFLREDVRRWLAEVDRAADGNFGQRWLDELKKREEAVGPRPRVSLTDVADMIDRLVERVGLDHVGIGSDFFGVSISVPDGLEDVSCFPHLLAEMFRRGWSDDAVAGLAGLNFIRTWEAIERCSAS